jgi:hypothetical protein
MKDDYKKIMKECLKDAHELTGIEETNEYVIMIAIELFKVRFI